MAISIWQATMEPETTPSPASTQGFSSLRLQLMASTLAAVTCGAGIASPTATTQGLSALVLVLILAAQWFATGRVVQALHLIEVQVMSLTQGQLVARLIPARCGVLAPLAERINTMARTLSGVFVDFARMSHELSSAAAETSSNA